jgi:hypothetical protein
MPEKVEKVIVVDIIPTHDMFGGCGDIDRGMRGYHWLFLSQPAAFPEILIKAADDGRFFLEYMLASWTAKKSLGKFRFFGIGCLSRSILQRGKKSTVRVRTTEPVRTWIERTMKNMLHRAVISGLGTEKTVCGSNEI